MCREMDKIYRDGEKNGQERGGEASEGRKVCNKVIQKITSAEKSVKTERIFQTALTSFMWIRKIRRIRSWAG